MARFQRDARCAGYIGDLVLVGLASPSEPIVARYVLQVALR